MRRAPTPEPAAFAAAALAAAVLIFFLPWWTRGLSPYWGDLTYLNQGWRATPAQLIQSGRAPLWEPALYMGMPMAASMQGGLFYPLSILFDVFGFATATAAFEALHLFLAGFLAALWLRSLRASWGAAVGAGISFAFGGLLVVRLSLLNHMAVLAWAPALLLFFRRPAALGAALALMFLAGYPTFIPGLALAAWGVALSLSASRSPQSGSWTRAWAAAALLALALAGAQLLPALELVVHSRRSAGVDPAEALKWSFAWSDFRNWVFPRLVRAGSVQTVDWWKCVYLGFVAAATAAWGAGRLPRHRATGLCVLIAVACVLLLGGSNPFSRALWSAAGPLRFVRYPGNLAYLAALPLTALVGAGLSRTRRAPLIALAIAVELTAYGWSATPVAPRGLFVEPGPLVRFLQARLGGTRYLLSPFDLGRGNDVLDWKTRLYGLTNAPFRLRSVANFGEPLAPAANFALMDFVVGLPNAASAAPWLPWLGASSLLTRDPPAATPLLIPEGRALWFVSRAAREVSTAYWLSPENGAALSAELPAAAPEPGKPLMVERPREDRLSLAGEGEGWVFLSEPRYPGWSAELETDAGRAPVESIAALGAFQKFQVPAGRWVLRLRYEPASWRLGVLLSLGALLAVGGYWYYRLSRLSHVA
jgi:hypothetical protein